MPYDDGSWYAVVDDDDATDLGRNQIHCFLEMGSTRILPTLYHHHDPNKEKMDPMVIDMVFVVVATVVVGVGVARACLLMVLKMTYLNVVVRRRMWWI